ncbi:protein sip-5 [Pseudoxanthomonas kalamensis DSM 18571]|uniref:protein sip-5 n=1 Tax=Pseudoxanthomonas kalamensis TaxID=289483 RepID=UPI0013909BCD|nr:protein sip-5 [Pseudoxanthomonas kalamensis]KAF1711491.1 protein sip-5 [Pseudoxanthomonas kalamensis DSM 18571]
MNYRQLQRRVQRAESVLDGRLGQVSERWGALRTTWREGWTPLRIVSAGLVGGFLVGRSEPLSALDGPRALRMLSSVSGLFATAQAAMEELSGLAAGNDDETRDDAPPQPAPTTAGNTTDDTEPVQPRPAEAATELSER